MEFFWFCYAECVLPLGMKSGKIEDSQITASDHIGKTAGEGEECFYIYLFYFNSAGKHTKKALNPS